MKPVDHPVCMWKTTFDDRMQRGRHINAHFAYHPLLAFRYLLQYVGNLIRHGASYQGLQCPFLSFGFFTGYNRVQLTIGERGLVNTQCFRQIVCKKKVILTSVFFLKIMVIREVVAILTL